MSSSFDSPSARARPPQAAKKRSILRHLLPVPFVLVALVYLGKWYRDAHFFDGYSSVLPVMETIHGKSALAGRVREELQFQGTPGGFVPALLHYPERREKQCPCVVFLYGNDMEMAQVDELANWYVDAGYAIFCQEQLGSGTRKDATRGLGTVEEVTKPLSQTVIEARRTVDYLKTRQEIDSTNLTLYGVTMGAVIAAKTLSLERRYSQGILTWGGGDFDTFFKAEMDDRKNLGGFSKWIFRKVFVSLLSPMEPLNCVHLISPRPLLMQNARHDESIPKVCIEGLHAKARLPKEIKWYETSHGDGLEREAIGRLVADQIAWLDSLKNQP